LLIEAVITVHKSLAFIIILFTALLYEEDLLYEEETQKDKEVTKSKSTDCSADIFLSSHCYIRILY
jgi:hypothetical protein